MWQVFKNAERNITVANNEVRMMLFDILTEVIPGEPSAKKDKLIADYVNNATGRGNLKSLEGAAETLSIYFFSARYWAAKINNIKGTVAAPFYYFGDPEMRDVRKIIAWEHGRIFLGRAIFFGSLYLAAKGYDDEDDRFSINMDPTSSDFMKLKVGNARFDFMGGEGSEMVFISRMLYGSYGLIKSSVTGQAPPKAKPFDAETGSVIPVNAGDFGRTIVNYIRGKLSPVAGATLSGIFRTDPMQRPTTWKSEAIGMFVPMTPSDWVDQWREFGPLGRAIAAPLTFTGAGGSVRDDNPNLQQMIAIKLTDLAEPLLGREFIRKYGDTEANFQKKKSSSNSIFTPVKQ